MTRVSITSEAKRMPTVWSARREVHETSYVSFLLHGLQNTLDQRFDSA